MKLADKYARLSDADVDAAILRAKRELGPALTILGHHYQPDEVIRYADHRGDSLELSRRAAQVTQARYIVFCGVYFMSETAAILCQPAQVVLQPEAEAFCPMARMAGADDALGAWSALGTAWGADATPITYQNSTADAKAFVGKHGGAVCTSANADRLFAWAWQQGKHILFLPDEHLGTNTALAMGVSRDEIGLWDPSKAPDGRSLADCRVVVWKGFCHVHTAFTVADVQAARARYDRPTIVVHPECVHEVVALADVVGSTTAIIRAVERAPAGATVVVGTEWHLVNRLAHQHRDKTVVPLRRSSCPNMGMTTARHLWYVLDGLLAGDIRNQVTVGAETAQWARVALERMLQAS